VVTRKEEGMFADLIGPATQPDAEPAHFEPYLHRVNAGQSLSYEEAHDYMRMVLAIDDDRQRSAQLGVLLNGIMAKHPCAEEATGVIDAALELDVHRPADRPAHPFTGEQVIGMAGSGKKGVKTPNISTPAAIVAAAAGIKVAKCASAATSSVAGSADTLKNLGVKISGDRDRTLEVMAACNLGVFEIEQMVPRFDAAYGGLFFAPHVLSLAFPALLLPIKVDNLLYGIAHPDVTLSLEVLRRYHRGDMLVVSSTPDNVRWIDEVGIVGETCIVGVRGGVRGHLRRLAMGDVLGVGPYRLTDLAPGRTPAEQARIVVDILTGSAPRALIDMVAVNAATLIYLGTTQSTVPEAFALAREVLASGAALATLRDLARLSGGTDDVIRGWL
jgi:anthranilate phosphoribosyltransferase